MVLSGEWAGGGWRAARSWDRPGRREIASESLSHLGASWPDFGSVDLGEGLLVAAAVVAFLLILIPVLFFGLELIILGVLLAAAVITHTVLGQPWVIEARSTDPLTRGRHLEWRVRGWRQSGKLIAQVSADLSAGREPIERGLPR